MKHQNNDQQLPEETDLMSRLWDEFRVGLRGRMVWASILGVALAIAAGTLIWFNSTPVYKSQAMLRVNSVTKKILSGTESSGLMQRYDNYLGAQVQVIRSERVTDMAMQDPAWSALGRSLTPESQREFRSNVGVSAQPASEMIVITFTDTDTVAAAKATESLVNAFLEVNSESERVGDLGRLRILEDRQATLTEQLSEIRRQMQESASEYGLAGIKSQYAGRIQAKTQIELNLMGLVETRASLAEAYERRGEESETTAGRYPHMAVNQNEIDQLEYQIEQVQYQIDLMKKRGVLEQHKSVQRWYDELELLEGKLSSIDATAVESLRGAAPSPVELEIANLDLQIDTAQREVVTLDIAIDDLKSIVERLQQLDESEDRLQARIAETANRIESLNLEAAQDDRIQVLTKNDVSYTPVNASTIVTRSFLGAGCGLVLGFVAVGGVGMMRREVRDSRDVMVGLRHRRLLGVVPRMEMSSNAEDSEDAMHSFEHLRTAVHLRTDAEAGAISLAVTGPVSGSGKTTTSLLLARSFAEAKTRTLLIDLDAEGQGLSRLIERCCLPRLGEALVRRFGISRRVIAKALKSASDEPLGELLVEQGVITEAQRDEALAVIQAEPQGLAGVLKGQGFRTSVAPTRWKRLDALTITRDQSSGFRKLGRTTVAKLLEEAKKRYELVIIDTGPTPGSVEGSFVVTAADHTLVVVARGDHRMELEACDGFLKSIGAPVIGYVMNRCDPEELERSPISVSRRSVSRHAPEQAHAMDAFLDSNA